MAATFPAPTIPYPESSGDESTPGLRAGHSRVQPPTPSPLPSAVGGENYFTSQPRGKKKRSKNKRNSGSLPVDYETGAGLPGLSTDSESEDLELNSYPLSDEDEEAMGIADRRRARNGRRRRDGDGVRGLGDRMVMADGDRPVLSKEEKKIADGKVMRSLALNALLIGLWYLFSLLISVYNKWMFSPEHLDFHFPLFVTCTHMIVQFSLSSLVLYALPQLRPTGFFGRTDFEDVSRHRDDPDNASGGLLATNSNSEERRKQQAGIMTKWFYATRVGPCGAATGLDIGLGNMSLKYITLTFYTMCKSSSLAFVLCFAFLFRLEKITWKLVAIISIMTAGVIMMVTGEAKFVLVGFLLVITASALSGLRWSLTQILLLRNPATSNPFSSIFFLAPVMFISILVIAIPVEGFGPLSERFGELVEKEGILPGIGIVLFPGVIAFLMVSSEFALLKRTSVITLSICGIFKEVMTISVAAVVFKDPLTPINVSGLVVTIISIAAYNYIKISAMRQEAVGKSVGTSTRSGEGYVAVGHAEGDDDLDADGDDEEQEETYERRVNAAAAARARTSDDHVRTGLAVDEVRFGESAVTPPATG